MARFSKLLRTLAFCVPGLLTLAPGAAQAQAQTQSAANFPSKNIRFVVPYPAGGSTDVLVRLIGQKMSENWGQPVIVDNRPGASGMIGNDMVAKSPPDGYTLTVTIGSAFQAPYLYPSVPYDPFKAFTPVSQLGLSVNLFVVTSNVPANTLKEFVALAKKNPGKYHYGSYGIGSTAHIHGEMFNKQAGLDLIHVAYKGGAPLLSDILGGQISAGIVDIGGAQKYLKSGKFKVLAVSGAKRFKLLPDVPTFGELGYQNFEPYGWWAVLAPAGTPKPIVDKLSGEIARIIRLPDVAQRIDDLGIVAVGNTPEELAAIIKNDDAILSKIIKENNIKAQ